MISDKNINSSSLRICLSLFSLQKCTIKQLLDSFFCDILNNQGLGKCYQPRPSARLITLTLTFIIHENHKNLIKQLFNIDKKKDSRRRQSLAVLAAMEKMGEKKQQLNRLKVTYCRRTGVISSIHGAVRVDANFTSIEGSMFLNGKDFE